MLIQELPQNSPRPFLKWAGGKSQLISQYTPHFPHSFTNYYEPFLGGGAVFFHIYNKYSNISSYLTDINPELVNAYCCVRDQVEQLISILEQHQQQHSQEYYYQVRAINGSTTVEQAARMIYLNKTCFNGLYRENSQGKFNVPVGRYKNPKICQPDLLRSVSTALQYVYIETKPFEAVLDYAKTANDFVYFDPPYYPLSATSNFTAYSRYSFNKTAQIELRNTFVELARRGVKVMSSNSDSPFIKKIYSGFTMHKILATRAINSNTNKRGKIFELLITSY